MNIMLSNPRAIMGHYGFWLPLTTLCSGRRCCDFSYRINTKQYQNTKQDTGTSSSKTTSYSNGSSLTDTLVIGQLYLRPPSQNPVSTSTQPLALSTLKNAFSKVCGAFSLSLKTHRLIRVDTSVSMHFRLSALKRLKTIESPVVT